MLSLKIFLKILNLELKPDEGKPAPVAGKGSLNRGERFMGEIMVNKELITITSVLLLDFPL
jgi:hypothetical protein